MDRPEPVRFRPRHGLSPSRLRPRRSLGLVTVMPVPYDRSPYLHDDSGIMTVASWQCHGSDHERS